MVVIASISRIIVLTRERGNKYLKSAKTSSQCRRRHPATGEIKAGTAPKQSPGNRYIDTKEAVAYNPFFEER